MTVSPRDCVRSVSYRFSGYPSSEHVDDKPPNAFQTSLWSDLKTLRKRSLTDELYDLSGDPTMRRNLLDSRQRAESVESLRRSIDRLLRSYYATALDPDPETMSYSIEEIESLRSLGYIE